MLFRSCRPKKEVMKAAVIQAVIDRGFDPEGDDNTADAIAIWLFMCREAGY